MWFITKSCIIEVISSSEEALHVIASGDSILSPLFNLLGIPSEVTELTIIRPFSSNAAYVLLKDIFTMYGPDSYVGKCASVIMGSSDTLFYVSSIYFAATKVKKTLFAIPLALFCNVIGAFLACFLCRFI